jgi:hypothetical protein
MLKINHDGYTKFYTIIPIILYISFTEIKQAKKIIGNKAMVVAIHLTPWLAFGVSVTKKFNEYEGYV